MINTLYHVTKY